jgi:GNAT superfamily N-acetyltransferase
VTEVTIWYLEQTEPAGSSPVAIADVRVEEARIKQYQFNRFLYRFVGAPWQWTDKLDWSDRQWRDYAERDELRTWAAWVEGSPAGYFELEKRDDNRVELCYFGLAEKFIGRGLGPYLLECALAEAWRWDASRVTVNTCTLDHPRALETYLRHGFRVLRKEVRSG